MNWTQICFALFCILLLIPHVGADEALMKRYEPFLFFHKEDVYKELFYPMNADAYVERCSLWLDQLTDKKERDKGSVNLELLANLGRTRDDSDKFYLKFVEKYFPSDIFPLEPKDYYWDYTTDALLEYINSSPKYTYYFRQFIEPDYGYLVLQYWFFYALNSWGAYSFGYNMHEGDWESITLFLHPVSKGPVYVAYSAHHEKGDKISRMWEDIRKSGTHPNVFVALGSHASYFEPKFDILTEILTGELPESQGGPFFDRANGSGMIIGPLKPENAYDWKEWDNRVILEDETHTLPDWAKYYNGKWGMDAIIGYVGFDGPRFPPPQDDSDSEKWYRPAKWAGINKAPASVAKAKIEIEDADSVWEVGLTPSGILASLARKVIPRIIVEYADSNFGWNLTESRELKKAAETVKPRIITEYADSSYHQNLQKSEALANLANSVSPRIIVEYADSTLHQNLQKSDSLTGIGGTVSPRIIIEYADSTFTRSLSRFSMSPIPSGKTLSMTSAEAAPGSSSSTKINVSDATGIASGDFTIKYDGSIVTVGDIKNTELTSGMTIVPNKNTPGELNIAMAGTKGIESGSGALLDIGLKVDVNAKIGTQTTLEFTDVALYNELGGEIPVSLESGILKVIQPQGIKGDVSGDGQVRSNDATMVLRITAGLMVPDDRQRWAADVNDDGKIASNDAVLILRMAAGIAAPDKSIVDDNHRWITIMLPEIHGIAGESVIVPLKLDNTDILAGGEICLSYDSTVLKAVDVSSNSEAFLVSNISKTGIIKLAFASVNGIKDRTFAEIKFDIIKDDKSPLIFDKVELYRLDGRSINSKGIDGRFISWAIPPKHSALLQNFPNPFNPDTWIPYQLSKEADVTIRIYNTSGQLIRTLILGDKSAGQYMSKDRAAYWDGKNEAGEYVSSGVYFYTIQTGDFTDTRKMIIVK